MTHDYYETLGIPKDASVDQIKAAYKNMAKKFHPDVNKDAGSEEKFKQVLEAYTVLSDPQKRQNYDQYGSAEAFAQGTGFDFSSIFKNMGFDDFSDVFSGFGMGEDPFRSNQSFRTQPVDVRMDVEISLEDAYFGVEKSIKVNAEQACKTCAGKGFASERDIETCPTCKGRGVVERMQRMPFGTFAMRTTCGTCQGQGQRIKNPCKNCHGTGKEAVNKTLQVKIPAGIESGNHLRLKKQGLFSEGHQGDLYLVVHVKNHSLFKRDGKDLFMKLPITFTEAALGSDVEFEHLNGQNETVSIPEGTQTDTVFRLKSKGMPMLDSHSFGDLFVEVKVKTPVKLTKEQRELLQTLGEKNKSKKGFLDRIKESFG